SAGKNAVESDLLAALKKSVQVIEAKVYDPLSFPKRKPKSDKRKISKSSLRGDSRYVQMAVCEVLENGRFNFLSEYACTEGESLYTMGVNEIEGYDPAGDKN